MPVEGLVSTIIPVHNRPELVVEAINSVLAQTYRAFEILVVDDGSTDETPGVVEEMRAMHPEISLLRQQNRGPGPARQTGLDQSQGEFIQFLDSDDLLEPDKYERQVEELRRRPECGACYGPTLRYSLDGSRESAPVKWTGRVIESMFPSFLADRWWDTSTPLYRSEIVKANGPWLNLRQEEDWEFDCRLAAKGVRLARVDSVVSATRVLPENRLSFGGSVEPRLLGDRCSARIHILNHAIAAGIDRSEKHMRLFLAGSFLVARQAALAGLEEKSDRLLLELNRFDPNFLRRLYRQFGKVIGLRHLTLFAERTRALTRGSSGMDKPA